MKKILYFVFAVVLFVLLGCSSKQNSEYYKFNRAGITEIEGTSLMSEDVNNKVIPTEKVEEILNKIEELYLKPANENDIKGWQYLFVVKYNDGSNIVLSLSEQQVKIDGEFYATTLYNSNDFLIYFN